MAGPWRAWLRPSRRILLRKCCLSDTSDLLHLGLLLLKVERLLLPGIGVALLLRLAQQLQHLPVETA